MKNEASCEYCVDVQNTAGKEAGGSKGREVEPGKYTSARALD